MCIRLVLALYHNALAFIVYGCGTPQAVRGVGCVESKVHCCSHAALACCIASLASGMASAGPDSEASLDHMEELNRRWRAVCRHSGIVRVCGPVPITFSLELALARLQD